MQATAKHPSPSPQDHGDILAHGASYFEDSYGQFSFDSYDSDYRLSSETEAPLGTFEEPENSEILTPLHVKDRFKSILSFWDKINANNWVKKVTADGYALPFTEIPKKKHE